ncbi:MAG: class I SAM-dependent methyltransferase [Lachnospiraceae bacterium]|nr:class I SAM-dependent methyltransferase [Lachnospiraceae bacterium]
MKIKNTRAINEKILSCVEQREYDRFISAAFVLPISSGAMRFSDEKKLTELAEQFLERAQNDGAVYTKDEALLAAMVMALVRKYSAKVDPKYEILYEAITRNGKIYHEGELASDPYLSRIWLGGEMAGHKSFSNQSYQPYELFFYDTPTEIGGGIKVPKIGAFDTGYNYPYLAENNAGLSGLTPYMINTMKDPIEKAEGSVLNLGCGMGYFAYMAHLKDNVGKVTVVEKDADLVELFQRHLLPQFEHPDKIEVIHEDPHTYLDTLEDGTYDFCFADLWSNNMDLVPYLDTKKVCRKFHKMKQSFWIEDSLTDMLTNMAFVTILEAFHENIGLAKPNPEGVSEEGKQVLGILRELLEKEEISRPDHIDWYLDPVNLLKMMR